MEAQTETAPLGIVDSLGVGFGTVAKRPILLLIPLLLDLFLWLGPRLSITPIARDLARQVQTVTGDTIDNSTALFAQNTTEILGSYNLFSALSTWPVGAPSLLAGNNPGTSPLGSPLTIPVQTPLELLAWLLTLVLAGLLVGSLYLGLIARRAGENHVQPNAWRRLFWFHWVRIVALVLLVLVGAFFVSVPFFLAVEVVAMILAPVAPLVLLAGIGLGMWGLFHLFFAAHGILLYDIGIRQAINSSVNLVRKYRLSSAGLLVVAVVISLGLSTIWNIPPSESWVRLAAIIGNAFVNTGLVAATFIYYRERTIRAY